MTQENEAHPEPQREDPLVTALKVLASTKDDNLMALMAREVNLYMEALVTRGNRSMVDGNDMRTLINRMLDIAAIKPRPRPASLEPQDRVDTNKMEAELRKPIPLAPVKR